MDIVDASFYNELPVGDVVTNLQEAARERICKTTGLSPSVLPSPLLLPDQIEAAVAPLKKAVETEVQKLKSSFEERLKEEQACHTEEINRCKRQRNTDCDEESNNSGDEGSPLAGTFFCNDENGCVAGCDENSCKDERISIDDLRAMDIEGEDQASIECYVKKYFCINTLQKWLDTQAVMCTASCMPAPGAHTLWSTNVYSDSEEVYPAVRVDEKNLLGVLRAVGFDAPTDPCRPMILPHKLALCKRGVVKGFRPIFKSPTAAHLLEIPYPWSGEGMAVAVQKGCKFTDYEEFGGKFLETTGGNDRLGCLYATAILLQRSAPTSDDYSRMQAVVENQSKVCCH